MVLERPTSHFIKHSFSWCYKSLIYKFIVVAVVIILACSISWLVPRLEAVGAREVSSQKLVVIDTDPGIDDAMAILTALGDKAIKVLAITCVRGNADVPNVVVNALKILKVANRQEVPVYTGHNYGLIDSPPITNWYGSDGLGDLPFPNPPSPSIAQEEHAASFLARIAKELPGKITVFAIGPLTNIAIALSLNPDFLKQIQRLIILGGSITGRGNAVPGVEFNFFMDPDAAALVLNRASSSGTMVTLMPLETCLDNDLTFDWRWEKMAKINNSVVSFLNQLDRSQQERELTNTYIPYDSFAVTALCPDFVTLSQRYYGYVENRGQKTSGALIIDFTNLTMTPPNLDVVVKVNISVIQEKLLDCLSNFL